MINAENLARSIFLKTVTGLEWDPEYSFHKKRKWRFDFANIKHKIAVEIEGGVWTGGRHTRGSGFLKDMEKYNTATSLGWKIIRVTPTTFSTCEFFINTILSDEKLSSETIDKIYDVAKEYCCVSENNIPVMSRKGISILANVLSSYLNKQSISK
jgi:hypothetical protein